MDSGELSEWMVFLDMEHLGLSDHDRADLRMGISTSAIVNALAKVMTDTDPGLTAHDFIPTFGRAEDTESASSFDPETFSAMLHARFPQAG